MTQRFDTPIYTFDRSNSETSKRISDNSKWYSDFPNEFHRSVFQWGPVITRLHIYTNLHYIALHCTALAPHPHTALHNTPLHCIALHLHCIALHCIALHCIALHCIALHCIALHCIALHCMHCTTLQLHYITLNWCFFSSFLNIVSDFVFLVLLSILKLLKSIDALDKSVFVFPSLDVSEFDSVKGVVSSSGVIAVRVYIGSLFIPS